jgi:DNA-binding winged helix-turn-helix (wHTH) protein/TolB-like protein
LLGNLLNKKTYEFGEFQLDLDGKRLLRHGQTVSLQPKVFDLLVFFVENHDALVTHDDLMNAVWKDTFVEESNLRFCIHALRKALGKNADGKDFVETVPKRGYRFTAEVREKSAENIPEKITAEDISGKPTSPENLKKPPSSKRYWLIGIAVFSIICLLVLAFAWQESNLQANKKPAAIKQLAVLPFEALINIDGDFQTGLAEEMILNLSKLKSLKVLPVASVRQFAGQNFDAVTLGKELQTDLVLSGSYRSDDAGVRVTLYLQQVENGEILWTETFTVKRKTNSELEQAIALRTARLFSLKFASTEDETLAANASLPPEAVQNYVAGRKIWKARELGRHEEMIKYFEKTTELAPGWSPGFSGLAEALLNDDSYLTGWEPIEQATRRALELDAANANAHAAQAQIYFFKYWDWENAEKSFKKALELNPQYAPAHNQYGVFLGIQRRFVEAENELQKALEAEPFSPFYYASLCELYYFDHRFDDALTSCYYAQNLEPDFWRTRKNLFQIYVQKKMYAEISELVLGKLSKAEKSAHPMTRALAANDLRPFWQNMIDESLSSKNSARNSFSLAASYSQLGEKEKALTYLEMAFEQHDDYFPTVNADPAFDLLRKEPRFVELMSKIGLRK